MRFDVTLKAMLEAAPADWPTLAGYAADRVEVVDADIATISGAADKVLRVRGDPDWIMHLDFQAGPDASLPRRVDLYNVALESRFDLLVRSVVVLLCPRAFLRSIDGTLQRRFPGDPEPYRTFRYRVIKVWELPVEKLLHGGMGTLPLAPISAVAEKDLPAVILEMKARLGPKARKPLSETIWTATYVLLGLKYEEAFIDQLMRGVLGMEESVTYQAIVRKGKREGMHEGYLKGLRDAVLIQGHQRFGVAADRRAQRALNAIETEAELKEIASQILSADSWQELLHLPAKRKGR